ncbi:MAG: aldehyde dehydrogenase [Gammaproteobacteria bacterium]|jgi:gamma-glutamyl-gamma-aminobutyraldehyde dehydrogenase|nr:aldehyde dehydrogenase [Gammaproteobacteria bacterium]MBP6050956.1 aldehyde dehydrogenase [Pseudomonadales bacterium]MBK6582463.1 aldehyde dehydrogenase [Gammaproteobacteria bacterium]MBK7521270.1 aldehyde dehydrogenase [Gammaproteobacteria bacterium]MBK7729043.1 aldehyde dehydrogenase [Gammaproteobacteria bacterium]
MSLDSASLLDHEQWRLLAERSIANTDTRLFIGGDYCNSHSGLRFQSVNPASGEILADVHAGSQEDIERAVRAARSAFRGGTWSKSAPRARMAIMQRWADLIDANADRLCVLETLDMGKPIGDVVTGDLPSVINFIRFCAECIDKIDGRVTSTEADALHFVAREPYGVVAAISPWNYPLLMATWKIAPALAAGNSVVLKPAEQAPLSCLLLAQLFVEAGGPAGVLNVVNGIGEIAGKALALHADVDKISFTGSTAVGKLMLVYAGQSNMKKVALECGGKSPQIFLADLPDIDRAVEAACRGIYSNQGEVCNAGSRLLVARSIHEEFVQRFITRAPGLFQPGDPLDPATTMGPLVDREAQRRVLEYIASGSSEGARLMLGGDTPSALGEGAFVNPTLFTDVHSNMRIAREEIFGPVASVIAFDDIDEALGIANDTIYGLAASIWTRDLGTAHRFIREIQAGVVWVNTFDDGDMTQPFGGYKQSGNAKDNCMDSVRSYTQEKSAWIRF